MNLVAEKRQFLSTGACMMYNVHNTMYIVHLN